MASKKRAPRREIGVGRSRAWQQALRAWDARRDLEQARTAASAFEEIAHGEDSADTWAWCARSHFFVGDYEEDAREAELWNEKGVRLGRRGVAREERHVGANFWTAACLAKHIEHLGVIRQAYHAPEAIRYLKRVYDEDMEYHYGALARFLGQAMVRQPKLTERFLKVAIPGTGPETVMSGLRRAIGEGPPFVMNVQTLGQVAFHTRGDRATVREMRDRLEQLDLDARPDVAAENHLDLPRARRVLDALL